MDGTGVSELLRQPAVELGRKLRAGEVSARELVEGSLARIEKTRELGHWTLVDADGALAAADGVQPGDARPFAGVPIAVKDLFAAVAGLRMSQGSDLVGDWAPDYDFGVVRRLKQAGFVIVGKTNTPEFGILPVTEPRRFGPARNPWDAARTTGGSSGGAAGAVASGCVPVAHGSDGGGSLRIPGACCGLVALKPSRGRVSMGPDLGEHFLNQHGVEARTTADAAALLDLIAGPEPGDASWAPPPPEPFAASAGREPGRLRIALTLDAPIDVEVDPLAERGARDAAELLEGLGHRVEEISAPWKGSGMIGIFTVLWSTAVALNVLHAQAVSGREAAEDDVEPLTWWLHRQGMEHGAPDYLVALAALQAFARVVISLWDRYDLVLTPALARRPVRHGEIDPCGEDPAREFARSAEFTPYTALFNVTGQPAISVPLFHGDDGLPLAIQLAGPPLGEGLLLQVCRQLEEARPWAGRVPPEPA
jgi:amidase